MNLKEILGTPSGPAMDRLVHKHVFASIGKVLAYSTVDAEAIKILWRIPLFVARVDPGKPDYKEEKPYVAGRLQHEQSVKGDITIMRVTGATLARALCCAALMAAAEAGGMLRRAGQPTMEERIGAQVASKRKPLPPVTLPRRVAQPTARTTVQSPRIPIPKRKPFVPGASIQPQA